jgi:hypothetical protein
LKRYLHCHSSGQPPFTSEAGKQGRYFQKIFDELIRVCRSKQAGRHRSGLVAKGRAILRAAGRLRHIPYSRAFAVTTRVGHHELVR